MGRGSWTLVMAAVAAVALAGCRPEEPTLQPLAQPGQRVQVLTQPVLTPPAEAVVSEPRVEHLVTVQAVDAPVRAVIAGIAQQAGLNVVVTPEVTGLVTVNLERVPAREALEAVLRAAGLGFVGAQGIQVAWNPTIVFYDLPVNVDQLPADAIMRRYGVSRELAEFMVRSRIAPP